MGSNPIPSMLFMGIIHTSRMDEYYIDEICSITHGKGSKLIDPRSIYEYDKMTSRIGY